MTTTIALQNKEGYITGVASNIGERTRKGAVAMKKRAGMSVRKMVAIVLFAVGAVFALGSTVNLALARVRKASRIAQVGHFRLLNIYNAIKASHPGFINAMNRATTGLASWYGGIFQGRKTAMGTTYNMNDMTAAHRTLPLGTWVRVTNQENDRSVVVQVTDRGPYVANRIMDLSYAAAEQLGYANAGTTEISMQVLGNSPDATEVADNGSTTSQPAVIPAMFKVSADSYNVNLSGSTDSTSDPVSDVINAVSDLAAGSPAQAATDLFA